MNARPAVLLIEDEHQIRRFLRITLDDNGFDLIESSTGVSGLESFRRQPPDLVLLDLGLPDIDGLEVISQIRNSSSHVPIIVLSARGQEQHKIAALDRGADDYITKPFTVGELLARLRAALRRSASTPDLAGSEKCLTVGALEIDLPGRIVKRGGEEVHLTPIEFDLLTQLVSNSRKVVTHKQLLKAVWGEQYVAETHYVRVYMAQLRHKLEENPARPRYILTEPGVGYRFKTG
jgi:two-component system KDP operon response regulator KdpE